MSDNDGSFDLSRRKLLGSAATLGSAAALGGAGSVAFFSDREEFANNRLVAGSLDLKVDWEEHYSDWSDDESEGIETVAMEPGEGLAGFPSTAPVEQQSVFVSDPDRFLANTAIEAFPDVLSEGADYDALQATPEDDSAICDLPADTPEVLSHPFRTRGTFGDEPNPQTTEAGDPLIDISDVKPGDFGEVTFSLHLCDNDGFVWLTADLIDAAENGLTEPEAKDPDEEEGTVELLDAARAAFWYDTGPDSRYGADLEDKDAGEGDNYRQSEEQIIALQGSLRNVLDLLEQNPFPLDGNPVTPAGGAGEGEDGDGGTGAATVTDADDATLYLSTEEPFDTRGARNLTCADYGEVLDIEGLVGTSIDAGMLEDGTDYAACGGTLTVEDVDVSGGTITVSSTTAVRIVSVKGGNRGENIYVWPEPGVVLDGVTLSTPENPSGNPAAISNIDVCCGVGDGNGGTPGLGRPEGSECLPGSTTAYVGFEWWLPVDHANEIQTDSVSFDLGFYAEQCRHNDGQLGNGGAGGGGDPDDGDDDDNGTGTGGEQAISFMAFCTDGDPDALNPTIDEELAFDDAGDPTSVRWSTDAPVDRVVVKYANRVTIYEYDGSITTGVATTGDTGDGITDREAVTPDDTRNPCGDLGGVKVEF